MKKYVNTAMFYMILGLVFGVFFREFTKYVDVAWPNNLGLLHVHTLTLGMLFFLIVAGLVKVTKVGEDALFGWFYGVYNAGELGIDFGVVVCGVVFYCEDSIRRVAKIAMGISEV